MLLNQSRQWVGPADPVSKHHLWRYVLAARIAKGRTLDAACGSGYGTRILRTTVNDVVGVDANPAAIKWAKENYQSEFICGRIEDRPWSGEFETVVSLETIEHIKEPEEAIKAFREACKGRFIASVPNEEMYPFVAENFLNDDSPHYRHYRPHEFQNLLEQCGFTVIGKFCQVSKHEPEVVDGTEGNFLVYVCQ